MAPVPNIIAQEFCVIEPGNYFAVDWVPIAKNFYAGQPNFYNTSQRNYSWMSFSAVPRGELFIDDPGTLTTEEAAPFCDASLNSPDLGTILKVEVKYTLGNNRHRVLRFDIGSGRNVILPPTFALEARILRPDGTEFEQSVPAGFDPDLFVVANVILSCKCTLEPSTGGFEATWSTPIHIQDPVVPTTRLIQIEDGAIAASACFNVPPASPLEFLKIRFDENGAIVDTTVVATALPAVPGTDVCIPRAPIPAEANFIRYAEVIAPPGITGTITQYLQIS
jgi:hypothetical protein